MRNFIHVLLLAGIVALLWTIIYVGHVPSAPFVQVDTSNMKPITAKEFEQMHK